MNSSLGEKRSSKNCSYSTTKASTAINKNLEQKLTGISQPTRQLRKKKHKESGKEIKKLLFS